MVGVPSSNRSNRSLDERGRQILTFEPSTIEKPTISSIPAVTDEPAKAERTESKTDAGFATVDHRREVDEPKPTEVDDPKSEVEEPEKVKKKHAPCEDRTHDLQIMRLTRYLLR